jgi:hypothetical protein
MKYGNRCFIDLQVIWFVSIVFIENWVETTHDDIQYSPEWWTSRWWYFVSVASVKLLLTTRHFIPNRLTVRSGKIRYEIPYVRSSTGWPKYTIEPIILILVEWSETNSNTPPQSEYWWDPVYIHAPPSHPLSENWSLRFKQLHEDDRWLNPPLKCWMDRVAPPVKSLRSLHRASTPEPVQ